MMRSAARRLALWLMLVALLFGVWGAAAFVQGAEVRLDGLPAGISLELAARGGQYTPLGRVSPWLVKAVVDTEDASFWTNPGVSPEGILRALFVDVETLSYAEGGSTLTQQLARDQFLGHQKTLRRKVAELAYAVMIARHYPKRQTLELFLNQAYFGQHAWGVAAAAQTYFALPPRDLNLGQAALMAGLLRAPTALDPLVHPNAARRRQREVLGDMVRVGDITPAEAASAAGAPLDLVRSS